MRFFKLLGICLLCSPVLTYANLNTTIRKLAAKTDPNLNYSYKIVDLSAHKTIAQHNANQAFTPASTLKLVTAAAAMKTLGAEFQYKTILGIENHSLKAGTVQGNVYIQFSGDPTFTRIHLQQLLSRLRNHGIKKITGDILLIPPHPKYPRYNPGWMLEDLPYGYGAPLGPIIVDSNRADLFISPKKIAWLDPENPLPLDNAVEVLARTQHCHLSYHTSTENRITVTGCINRKSKPQIQSLAIQQPVAYASALIRRDLKQFGISLYGKVLLRSKAPKLITLEISSSMPLHRMLVELLKNSDNLYADSFLLALAKTAKPQDTLWHHGIDTLKNNLQKYLNLDVAHARMVDGSGLSAHDTISAQLLSHLLIKIYHDFQLHYDLIPALPVACRDGTLLDRFCSDTLHDRVRAKTGGMTGVSTLVGYVKTRKKHLLAFVIMMNHIPKNRAPYYHLQAKVLKVLIQTV